MTDEELEEERERLECELLDDVFKEKEEWLKRSIWRLWSFGTDCWHISAYLDFISEDHIKQVLHDEFNVDWSEIK